VVYTGVSYRRVHLRESTGYAPARNRDS
jgi:hypothetical protein